MTREGAPGGGTCDGVSRVSDLMSPNPITVREDALVKDVLHTMAIRRIRHILVVDGEGRLVGLLRRQVATVTADCCTGEAARYMFRTKRGCLPVVDQDRRPSGIVTEADFPREFMRAGAGCGCSALEDDWPRPSPLPA